jgi:hypothetical protein
MLDRGRILVAAVAAVTAATLAGCAPSPPPPNPTPTPTATRMAVEARTPQRSVTVLDSADPLTRAVDASRTLFTASPGVVLAPAGDAGAVRQAAAVADRLAVPLLLVPAHGGAALEAVRAEAARLSAIWAALVGPVSASALPSLRRADPGRQAPPPRVSTGKRPVVVLAGPADPAAAATARAARAVLVRQAPGGDVARSPEAVAALAAHASAPAVLIGSAFASAPSPADAVAAARSGFQLPGGGQRPLPGHRFVALYGVPGVPVLGALGDQGIEAGIRRVRALAEQYRPLSSEPVVPTFEIIATVAAGAPGADRRYSTRLDPASLLPWVTAARRAGVEVILDLQPGRADFPSQARYYAGLLEQPNVGLALDPEWRLGPHQVPLKQIGSVSAAEVNRTSEWLAGLVTAHHLPPKLFVLHQFRRSMLADRGRIVQRQQLTTVIHVDGQGGQPDKQGTWHAIRDGAPVGVGWGWKNFLHKDHPMLTPEQTMSRVRPQPDLISYQ